jgi:rhodanese-related sulfurtransferase
MMIRFMNKLWKSRCLRSFLLLSAAFAAAACGGEPPAPDAAPAEAAAPSSAAPAVGVTTDAQPIPELRVNDAGAVLVSQEEVLRLIDSGDAPMILDVRTAEEFAEGHVPGAVNISHDELAERLAEIDSARAAGLIVYCRSGRRAGIAETLLLGEGFQNVQHLEGDMNAWVEAARPLQKQQ